MSESILRNSGLTQVEGGGWGQFCEKISSIYTEVRPLPYHASRCHGWETTLAVRGLSRPHHCFFFEWVSSAQIISIGRLLPRYLRHGCPDRQAIPVTGEDTYLLTLLTSQSRDRVDRVRVVPSNAPLGRGIRFQNHSILVAQGFEPGFNTKSGCVFVSNKCGPTVQYTSMRILTAAENGRRAIPTSDWASVCALLLLRCLRLSHAGV